MRKNDSRNALLWQAGDRLRGHWHLARLDGMLSIDFGRPYVDGRTGGTGTSPTEAALRHRDAYRAACDAIGSRLLPFVTALAIEARTVADLRPLVTDTAHARTADALAIERLREGLHRLCEHWRMGPNEKPRPINGWRDEAPVAHPDA